MSTEIINEETAVQVAESINDAAEVVVEYVDVVRNNPALLVGAFAIGAAAGVAGGYFLVKKRLGAQFDQRLENEIRETQEFYSLRVNKLDESGKTVSPQDVLTTLRGEEAAAAALAEYAGDAEEDETQLQKISRKVEVRAESIVEEAPRRNVFADRKIDLEKQQRSEDVPYIITEEEFFSQERDYEQSELTYFAGDDTLVDEKDKPVDDLFLVGEEHLGAFGSGTKQPNKLYVRNPKLEMEFEITRSNQTFLEALGLGPEPEGELRHSRDSRRAFRQGEG